MSEQHQRSRVSLAQLALTCLYIGVTGYGGPAIVGHMKRVFVDRKKWITEQDFITGLSLSQILPSATGANTIEFLGYRVCGTWGALIAPICFIIPSLILMTALSAVYFKYGQVPVAKSLFTGLGAVVIALIITAAVTLGKSAIKDRWALGIAGLGFVIARFLPMLASRPDVPAVVAGLLKNSIPLVVLVSAVCGFLIYRRMIPAADEDSRESGDGISPAFWIWFAVMAVALVTLLVLTAHSLVGSLLLAILHVGALTFGGGFMSIPLFQHQAVEMHHWLTNRQFLDGIALGQITPGPVLITACFIGYKVLGIWGSLLAGLTIFSPGAVGMFVVAHQHERVSHLAWLKAMVKGIVAGFMGVLLSVILRLGTQSITDWKTAGVAAVALIALLVAKVDPLWVIIVGAVLSIFIFA